MGAKVIISNLHPNVSQGDIKVSSLILKASDVIRFCSEIASLQWRPSSITSFMEHFQGIGKIWYKLKHFWSNFGDIWIELFEFSEYFLFEQSLMVYR